VWKSINDLSLKVFDENSTVSFKVSEFFKEQEEQHQYSAFIYSHIRKNGNGPRIEVAVTNRQHNADFVQVLKDGVETAITLVRESTRGYGMHQVLNSLECFSNALHYRLYLLLKILNEDTDYHRQTVTDTMIMAVVQEVVSLRQSWFNGKYPNVTLTNAAIGLKLSRVMKRPILRRLDTLFSERSIAFLNSIPLVDNQTILQLFWSQMGYMPIRHLLFTQSNTSTQETAILPRRELIACSLCLNLFEKEISRPDFESHFCLLSKKEEWSKRSQLPHCCSISKRPRVLREKEMV
jgi:hypothetical protein